MKSRIVFIFVIFLGMWGVMFFRATTLQIVPNQRLAKVQKRQFKKMITLQSRRGAILDRSGQELAVTVPSYSLYADPSMIERPKEVVSRLSHYLGIGRQRLKKILTQKKRRFTWIKRYLDEKARTEIESWKFKGVAFIEEPKRVYPNQSLLANVLGFVGSENKGLEGLELGYDKKLSGEKRKVRLSRDARGRPLIESGNMFTHPPEGSKLKLTVDAEIQFFLEKELDHVLEYQNADAAIGIVLDAKNAEVVAIASSPTYDPNKAGLFVADYRRNRAVTDSFEQGSTVKTFVIGAALKEGVAQPNSRYDCEGGKLKIGRRTVSDSDDKHKYNWLTVSEILAKSSNVGMTKLAFDIGAKKIRRTLLDFGFGEKSGVDLPGESRGIVQKLPWRPHLLSNVSFGHGISATPMQIAAGYVAIANGGTLYRPRIVKSIVDPKTGDSTNFEPEKVRQVLSAKHADMLRMMLMGATGLHATGYRARIPGFPVAGKTGTAQKVKADGRGYLSGAYISSFAGFVPANKPEYVIYIAVDNPKKQYYGSSVAAPVFSKVAQFAMLQSGTVPVMISQKNIFREAKMFEAFGVNAKTSRQEAVRAGAKAGLVPNLIGLSLREALQSVHGIDMDFTVRGAGRVQKMRPAPGQRLPKNKRVSLLLESGK